MDKVISWLSTLAPETIDPSKCTKQKSLYHQILKNSNERLSKQEKVFNLGNGQTFNDPILSAEYLLQREYGDSFLFHPTKHDPLFIPSVWTSKQFEKQDNKGLVDTTHSHSQISVLDFEIDKDLKKTLDNLIESSPHHWFTCEFESFMTSQSDGNPISDDIKINEQKFQDWLSNVKLMYMIAEKFKTEKLTLPSTIEKFDIFLKGCISELRRIAPESELTEGLSRFSRSKNGRKSCNKMSNEFIQSNWPRDSNIRWIFDMTFSVRGEKVERWFFDQLALENNDINADALLDLVLTNTDILRNLKNRMSREFDLLIFSWSRKLIIGVEMKRSMKQAGHAVDQLDEYLSLFEEYLGDQFGQGWTFFPVVCFEEEKLPIQSHHFIDMRTDIKQWLTSVLLKFPEMTYLEGPLIHPVEGLKKVLQMMLFVLHVSKPITATTWFDYITNAIEVVSSRDNIVFYSKNQLPVFVDDNQRYKNLVITGGYSTGKSFLLKQKALLLNEDPEYRGKVMYVCRFRKTDMKNLFYWSVKHELEPRGITVRQSNEVLEIDLKQMITSGKVKALFLDEWIIDMRDIKDIADSISFLWIVSDATNQMYKKQNDLNEDFEFLQLTYNLRNAVEIVQKSESIIETKPFRYGAGLAPTPPNFPRGAPPVYMKTIEEAIVHARKLTSGGILLVAKSLYDVPLRYIRDEGTKLYGGVKCFVFPVEKILDPIQTLKEGKVLITNPDFVSGFEWPTVIFLSNNRNMDFPYLEYHDCNIVLRCTNTLIIVDGKEVGAEYAKEKDEFLKDVSRIDEEKLEVEIAKVLPEIKSKIRGIVKEDVGRFKVGQPYLSRMLEMFEERANPIVMKRIKDISVKLNGHSEESVGDNDTSLSFEEVGEVCLKNSDDKDISNFETMAENFTSIVEKASKDVDVESRSPGLITDTLLQALNPEVLRSCLSALGVNQKNLQYMPLDFTIATMNEEGVKKSFQSLTSGFSSRSFDTSKLLDFYGSFIPNMVRAAKKLTNKNEKDREDDVDGGWYGSRGE
ncbi:uncharacterized protein [Clytia hemisphaerica]